MKIKNVWAIASLVAILIPLAAIAQPVPGISGGKTSSASFAPEIQAKVNSVGATLTAANISGNQSVGGNTVNVDPAAAQVAFDVISSPSSSDSPAVAGFVTALGGGESAQQLAKSMQGLRGGDGTINSGVLSGAISSYNVYLKSLIDSSKATEKSTSELDKLVQSFPAGQRAAQVVLGKLVEATR